MNVAYLGPLKDYSGYGEANRHAAAALDAAGINVIGKLVNYVNESADFGTIGRVVNQLCNNEGEYRIKIIHTTPNEIQKHKEPGKYHVAHFFWETDRVPDDFVAGLKQVDEIWTGSKANAAAIRGSGVDIPIKVFPQAIETNREWPEPYVIPEMPEDTYYFYSIFEWTDRKNPQALLRAFWEEFEGSSGVALLIKSYFKNFALHNTQLIRSAIELEKGRSDVKDFPPVGLYSDLMDREQVMRFHKTGDVYVSAHRGEGWGIPQVEAMLAGRPIISTGYGGVNEYLKNNYHGLVLPYEMVPVRGMRHSDRWYDSKQNWAEVDHAALRKAMRWCFEERLKARKVAERGQKLVVRDFNLETVGKAMAARLQEIEAGL